MEGSTTVQDVRVLYVDDLALVAEQRQDLQGMLTIVDCTHLFERPNPRRGGVLYSHRKTEKAENVPHEVSP